VKNTEEKEMTLKPFRSTKTSFLTRQVICYLLLFFVSSSVFAVNLSVDGHGGLDSNPHRLSSQFDPDIEFFSIARIKLSNRFENGVYIKARSRHAFYPDDDRGDSSKTKLDLGYRSKFKLGDNKFDYKLSTDWTDRDKNYVSRTTGEDATFAGESIVDRYDYVSNNLNAEVSFRTKQKTRFRLSYQQRDKDYENFSIPGLNDFDYSHDRYKFGVEFRPAKKHRLIAEIGQTDRKYDDRRIDDINGNEIANTDLEYEYSDYLLGYVYRPDQDLKVRFNVSNSERSDNGVGYNDSNYDRVSISVRKQMNELEMFNFSLAYSDYAYDNRSFDDPALVEEDTFDNQGYQVKFDYHKNLQYNGKENLSLIYTLQADDYDSTDTRYEYSRVLFSIGLKYKII
jgi:hypothetical protein